MPSRLKQFLFVLFFLFLTNVSFAKHEGELGYCVFCDIRIMDRVDNYLVKNQEYTELWFELSNNSICKIGFCKKHSLELSEKDYPTIIKGLQNGWNKEFEINKWTKKQIYNYAMDFFTLKIRRRLDEKEIPVNS